MEGEPSESRLKLELDRISNLPSELMNMILSRLPIREAVRTCVLSRKWRNKSAILPELSFDDRCISNTSPKTIADVVFRVLLNHIGPIYAFQFSSDKKLSSEDMNQWILYLSRNGVQDFRLTWKGHRYKIPSCLLSCLNLNELVLSNCLIRPPPTFEGFRILRLLSLTNVELAEDVFENLILRCPVLEHLTLADCTSFNHLKIDAPNLCYLSVKGVFMDVSLLNTKLTYVVICLANDVANDQRMASRSSSNLLTFLVHLPRIQELYINPYFLKYLSVGFLPGKLPHPLLYLTLLAIQIRFHDEKEILTTLCLLRSSPALRELKILGWKDKQVVEEVNYASEENRNCQFSQLQRVRMVCISAVKAELDFVKFLLSSSPVLERMTVKPASPNDVLQLSKQLLQFKRASTNAEVILDD